MYKTDESVKNLADSILSEEEVIEVKGLIDGLRGEKKEARQKLIDVLGQVPRRPLYYIAYGIEGLPEYGTRDIMRYCGDYIDNLVQFALRDRTLLGKIRRRPLGPNIKSIKKYISLEVYESLKEYNVVYTRAKHDFILNRDESLFSFVDAVLMLFITRTLADEILAISESARDYVAGGPMQHYYKTMD